MMMMMMMDRASYNIAIIIQKTQQNTVYLNLSTAQCFGWYFTHHQELMTLYLQYLPDTIDTVFCCILLDNYFHIKTILLLRPEAVLLFTDGPVYCKNVTILHAFGNRTMTLQ